MTDAGSISLYLVAGTKTLAPERTTFTRKGGERKTKSVITLSLQQKQRGPLCTPLLYEVGNILNVVDGAKDRATDNITEEST